MASIKISELEEVTELSTSDVLPIINENETKKVSIEKLSEILGGSGGGTVDVDLTNYYTKDEVNVLIENNTPGAKTYIAKDVYSRTNASPDYITPASTGGKNILAAVQKAYNNGDYTLRLRMYANNPSLIPQYIDTVLTLPENGNGAITETTTRTYVFSNITATTLKYYYFSKNIKMTNGEVVAGSTSSVGGIYYKEETLVNTTTLNDYVKTTTMNTELAKKQNTLTAGDNITIDENNVISAAGGGSVGQPFYVIELSDMSNELLINSNTNGAIYLNKYGDLFNEFLNTVKDDPAPLLYLVGKMEDTTTDISKTYQGLFFRLSGTSNGLRNRGTSIEMLSLEYMTSDMANRGTYTFMNRLLISCTWADDVPTCGTISLYRTKTQVPTTSQILTKTNTTSFTPTADYHPATKKYVDDSVAAAITTVLEAEY